MSPERRLASGLATLGFSQTEDLSERLLSFSADLLKWNKVYNLTAIKTLDEVVIQHLLDSLSISDQISGDSVIDVGTGGGFPGVPLAMVHPNVRFTLLDSNVKKTRFLQQMVINHKLENCDVLHMRAESCEGRYQQVVCRAFASLPNIVKFCGHLVADGGALLAMKGQPEEEPEVMESAGGLFRIENVLPLEVPHLTAMRHLVVLVRDETDK